MCWRWLMAARVTGPLLWQGQIDHRGDRKAAFGGETHVRLLMDGRLAGFVDYLSQL